MLLGGEAGLRCGEIMALEWTDVDLQKRQLCVARSEWKGHVTVPKGGRLRYVPLTVRLAAALKSARHMRGPRVVCEADGQPLTQKRRAGADASRRASRARQARRAHPATHVLFTPGDARGARAGDPGARGASGSRRRRSGTCTSVPRRSTRRFGCSMPLGRASSVEGYWRRREFDPLFVKFLGKMVEAAGVEPASERPVAAELYMRSRPSMFRVRHQSTAKAPDR